MNAFSRLRSFLFPPQRPPADPWHRPHLTLHTIVEQTLRASYPDPEHRPLPRGTITRVAHETGCSVSLVSRVAKQLGYHTEIHPDRK